MKNFCSKIIWFVFFALISLLEFGCTIKPKDDLRIQEKTPQVVEFRLVKSKTMLDDSLIELSEKLTQDQHIVKDDSNNTIASWLPIYAWDKMPFFPLDTRVINDLLYRKTDKSEIEVLVEKDIYDISNEHIQEILINPPRPKNFPKTNTNDLFIKLNRDGGWLLSALTNVFADDSNHDESAHCYLCFILNNEILFIVEINSPISYPEFHFSLHFQDEDERVKQEKELKSILERLAL